MQLAHSTQYSSTAIARLWNSPCPRYTLLTAIVSAALACIIVGAIAYSGSGTGLKNIGTVGGIALMSTGGGLGALTALIFCLVYRPCCVPTSVSESPLATYYVKPNELFVYKDPRGKKCVYVNDPRLPLEQRSFSYESHYEGLKQHGYKEVSASEIDLRANPANFPS